MLYDTLELATILNTLRNYGESRQATAVNKSHASDSAGHLTYLVNGLTVVSASWDAINSKVVKKTLLNLALESTATSKDVVTDMFVFDNLVAVRLETKEFKFFPIPLVAGSYSNEIPMKVDIGTLSGQFNDYSGILAYGMR